MGSDLKMMTGVVGLDDDHGYYNSDAGSDGGHDDDNYLGSALSAGGAS